MRTASEFQTYKFVIADRHSPLSNVYGIDDGLKLYLEESSEFVVQNMFYRDGRAIIVSVVQWFSFRPGASVPPY